MLPLLCLLTNIVALIYFANKKWRAVSICYTLSLCVLLYLGIFALDTTPALVDIFGKEYWYTLHYSVTYYAYAFMSPYLALMVLSLVSMIVITLRMAESVLCLLYKRKRTRLFDDVQRSETLCVASEPREEGRRFLLYCSLLC